MIIKSINAIGRLTEATAIALKDGKTNGSMHSALEEYEEADKEMYKSATLTNKERIIWGQ